MKGAVKSFEVGDEVKYTSKFLKSVGGYTGWPQKGKVTGRSEEIADFIRVMWDNGHECLVNAGNIMLGKKPDYSGM